MKLEAVRRSIDLVEAANALGSADRAHVGWRADHRHVTQYFTRSHVVPVARLRRIALKDTTIGADRTVGSGTHVIREGGDLEREAVNIESVAAIVLIHTVIK